MAVFIGFSYFRKKMMMIEWFKPANVAILWQ